MPGQWLLDVRDKPGALWAICAQFIGRGAISFEGDLERFSLASIPGATTGERGVLQRSTESPKLDFVVVPVTEETVARLKATLTGSKVFGRNGAVIHVQLESGGHLVFTAYDNFDKDCVVAEDPISVEFLEALAKKRLLRSYAPAA